MSVATLSDVKGVRAEDVFKTLHVLAPDGEACLPPCLIMTAAREMGYCPTSQYLQSSLEVVGKGKCLTFPLFLQLCVLLESTKAPDIDAIGCYKRAFDVRNSGLLSRKEFCNILTSSAAAKISSSEVEAILELLDPMYTGTIQLNTLQEVLLQYLSKDANHPSGVSYSLQSPRIGLLPTTDVRGDVRPQPSSSNVFEDDKNAFLCDFQEGVGRDKEESRKPESAAPNDCGLSNGRAEASQQRRPTSLISKGPRELNGPDGGLRCPTSPKPSAPSPYTSGTVTRATSVWQNVPLSEPPLQQLSDTVPQNEHANPSSVVSGGMGRSSRAISGTTRRLASPDRNHHTLLPLASEVANVGGQRGMGDILLVNHDSRLIRGGECSMSPEISLGGLRSVSLDTSLRAGNTNGILHSHNSGVSGGMSEVFSTGRMLPTADGIKASRRWETKKRKMLSKGCCRQF